MTQGGALAAQAFHGAEAAAVVPANAAVEPAAPVAVDVTAQPAELPVAYVAPPAAPVMAPAAPAIATTPAAATTAALAATAAPATPVAPPSTAAAVEAFVLPLDSLQTVAETAGLQWVNSDTDKIRAVQAAMASAPAPVHVPRERKPTQVADEGPLVLVETRKDLSQFKLPFETTQGGSQPQG